MTEITADEEVVDAYQNLKIRRAYAWIICKVADDKTRVVVESKATTGTFNDFVKSLRKLNSPRFVIYDPRSEWQLGNRLVFFIWLVSVLLFPTAWCVSVVYRVIGFYGATKWKI